MSSGDTYIISLANDNRSKHVTPSFTKLPFPLTHQGVLWYIYGTKQLGQLAFRLYIFTCSASSHYLNRCWRIANWTLKNPHWCSLSRYTNIFSLENELICFMQDVRHFVHAPIAFEKVIRVYRTKNVTSTPCKIRRDKLNVSVLHMNKTSLVVWKH